MTDAQALCESIHTPLQFSIFDKPDKIRSEIQSTLDRELNELQKTTRQTEIMGKTPDMWVRKSILRGFVELIAVSCAPHVQVDAWLLTPCDEFNGLKPIDMARDHWEDLRAWIRKISGLEKEKRISHFPAL